MSFVSVVVLTCNAYTNKHGCIDHTILALLRQARVDLEIIVVDNGGGPNDQEALARFVAAHGPDIRIVRCATSIAAARNEGARHAQSDLLVFVDEDTIPCDELALALVVERSAQQRHGYGARRLWTRPGAWFSEHGERLRGDLAQGDCSFLLANSGAPDGAVRGKRDEKYLSRSFIGNFGFVKRGDFEALGGFPTRFAGYGLEDDALSFLCFLRLGEPAILDDVTVVHVTHSVAEGRMAEYRANLLIYRELLVSYGFTKFHIGDLMYPESKGRRPILE